MISETDPLKDKLKLKRYIRHSDKLTDDDLDSIVTKVLLNKNIKIMEEAEHSLDSPNKQIVDSQQQKCL